MRMQVIQEGKIKLKIPTEDKYKAAVFYNPEAELQRDISVAVLAAWKKFSHQKISVCDALAASGIRGLRYAKEVSGLKEVVLNDHNPIAARLIKQNIKLNKLSRACRPNWQDANLLLHSRVFNYIDLDPFGSPNLFLDPAGRSIWHKGFLAVTATDTAPLCGTYPQACLRKYGIYNFKGADYYRELGMRVLVSYIILTLARWDRAFVPMLSHATTHYFRAYGRIEHVRWIEKLLKQFDFISHCLKCGWRAAGLHEKCGQCGAAAQKAGPIYLGALSDKKFSKVVLNELARRKFKQGRAEEKILRLLISESGLPAFYYDLNALGRLHKIKIPKIESLISELRKRGFKAGRTHFCPTAVKTNATLNQLLSCLQSP